MKLNVIQNMTPVLNRTESRERDSVSHYNVPKLMNRLRDDSLMKEKYPHAELRVRGKISSFSFTNKFILLRVAVDPDPIPGHLNVKCDF